MKGSAIFAVVLFSFLQGAFCNKCFSCGWRQEGEGQPGPMGDESTKFCFDSASFTEDLLIDCDDNCCFVLKEEAQMVVDGETKHYNFALHGCLKNLSIEHDFKCQIEGNRDCHETDIQIPGHEGDLVKSEMCICTEDKCNKEEPEPTGSFSTTPTTPGGPMCYDCGYMSVNGEDPTELPEGVAFCKDVPNAEDATTKCSIDDCCASVKEYTTENGKSVVVARHTCLSTINHEYNRTCGGGDSCAEYNFNRNGVSIRSDVCTCNGPLCNNKEATVPPSGANNLTPSVFLAMLATTLYAGAY